MRYHGTDGGFAMGTGYTNIESMLTDDLQNIASFHHGIPVLPVKIQLSMTGRNGGRKYHCICIPWCAGQIIRIVNLHTGRLQFKRQWARRFIVPTHLDTQRMEIPRKGAHTNTADTDEINMPYVF
jgi:hypothetical protein